jgi:hypothetical protein
METNAVGCSANCRACQAMDVVAALVGVYEEAGDTEYADALTFKLLMDAGSKTPTGLRLQEILLGEHTHEQVMEIAKDSIQRWSGALQKMQETGD